MIVGSIELLAERCLMPGFEGVEAPAWLMQRVAGGLGSVCLYARNVESPAQLARLCATLHAANPSLVIAIDEEGGDVTRLEAATGSSYPGNLALGAVGDPGLTREVARAIGPTLRVWSVVTPLLPIGAYSASFDSTMGLIGAVIFGAIGSARSAKYSRFLFSAPSLITISR